MSVDQAPRPLKEQFTEGLQAPICLTWELTYSCNLACVHCLSSSGRQDPEELTPAEARQVVDEMVAMKVFYVNIGGGERPVPGDQDGPGIGIVFRLRDQVRGNPFGATSGGDDHHLGGAGVEVDRACPRDERLGSGDVAIARTDNFVHARH